MVEKLIFIFPFILEIFNNSFICLLSFLQRIMKNLVPWNCTNFLFFAHKIEKGSFSWANRSNDPNDSYFFALDQNCIANCARNQSWPDCWYITEEKITTCILNIFILTLTMRTPVMNMGRGCDRNFYLNLVKLSPKIKADDHRSNKYKGKVTAIIWLYECQ